MESGTDYGMRKWACNRRKSYAHQNKWFRALNVSETEEKIELTENRTENGTENRNRKPDRKQKIKCEALAKKIESKK